ncbi:MAG: 50S ribosomal protein L21 [Candidatus Omnitrophica bacterium]|nr:50S ribosomal protein L21 [Candidatus Omnitrophota bacterium]
MYAIVAVGNKQLKVAENEEFLLEIPVKAKQKILILDQVLLIVKDKKAQMGNPYLKGAKVNCEVIARVQGVKKIAFKFRRRKSSECKKGSRQHLVKVRVKEIVIKSA